jgi:predicted AAA+ superfamily ATPase
MEKVLTPIEDEEVAHVIRKRLFKNVDESLAEEIIQEFIDYAEREGFLKMDKVLYKQRFKASYPFQP